MLCQHPLSAYVPRDFSLQLGDSRMQLGHHSTFPMGDMRLGGTPCLTWALGEQLVLAGPRPGAEGIQTSSTGQAWDLRGAGKGSPGTTVLISWDDC